MGLFPSPVTRQIRPTPSTRETPAQLLGPGRSHGHGPSARGGHTGTARPGAVTSQRRGSAPVGHRASQPGRGGAAPAEPAQCGRGGPGPAQARGSGRSRAEVRRAQVRGSGAVFVPGGVSGPSAWRGKERGPPTAASPTGSNQTRAVQRGPDPCRETRCRRRRGGSGRAFGEAVLKASLWPARGCKESVRLAGGVSSHKIVKLRCRMAKSDGLGFPASARAGHRLPPEKEPERKRLYISSVR